MKTYIIYLKDNQFSAKMTEEAIKSLESFGIEYELFDGVKGREGIKVLSDHNRYPSAYFEFDEWTDGTIGCLASHYLLWDKCAKQNEPFLILEQDAVVVRDPRLIINKVEKVCHLDGHLPFDLKRKNHFDYYNKKVKEDREGLKEYPKSKFYNGKVTDTLLLLKELKIFSTGLTITDYFLLMDVLTIEQLTYSVLMVLM